MGMEKTMAREAHSRNGPAMWLWRALLPPAVVMLLLLTPVAAGASEGTSEWPTTGGSSQWPAESAEEVPASTLPDAAAISESDPVLADPTIGNPPVAAEPAESAQTLMVDGIAFPISGPANYSASFGAPRPGGRTHEGVDIFAEKMTPVVAAAAGTVSFVRDGIGTDCCVVRIRHDDGRSTLYLHLNNDTPGTDDGQGYGIAEGIKAGVRVQAGTVIGYVGDSGNAEETPSHLHFELADSAGTELDPFPYLQVSQGAEPALFASALLAQPETLPDTGLPVGGLFLISVGLLVGGAMLTSRSREDQVRIPQLS